MPESKVTISRLSESALDELEKHIENLHDEQDLIDSPQITAFRALIMGYDAAWDEVEKRHCNDHLLKIALDALRKVQTGIYDCDISPIVEKALQSIGTIDE